MQKNQLLNFHCKSLLLTIQLWKTEVLLNSIFPTDTFTKITILDLLFLLKAVNHQNYKRFRKTVFWNLGQSYFSIQ